MQGKKGIAAGIGLTILAFIIGLLGIAVLIGIGESANNTIAAFAGVSFPFALLAGFFSWLAPRARWAIAAAICAPVAILGIAGSWSSALMLPGVIWTVALSCGGAYLGSRLKVSRSRSQEIPPS